MEAERFKTRLLTSIGFSDNFAFDLDIHANDKNKNRVIFSFDSEVKLDKFFVGLKNLMEETGCWSSIKSINGIVKER